MYRPPRFPCFGVAMLVLACLISPSAAEATGGQVTQPPASLLSQLSNPQSPEGGRSLPRFLPGEQDAFFRVPHRTLRKLRHRRGFIGDPAAKRSPRFADHDDPVFLTAKDGGTLIVTSDGRVATSMDPHPKDGEILRQVVGDTPPRYKPGDNQNNGHRYLTANFAKYYLKAKRVNRFICMNRTGHYFSNDKPEEECKFIVMDHKNNYQSYCSATYAGSKRNPMRDHKRKWCIGIDKDGKLRPRVKPNKGKAHFLAREIRPNSQMMPDPDPDFGSFVTTPKTETRNSGKSRTRKPKPKKCEEATLFSRKCAKNFFRIRRNRRRNARGHRRRNPKQRPLQWDRHSFFSKV